MSPEVDNLMHGESMAQQTGEALAVREQFFELGQLTDNLFCGDERPSDESEAYLSLFGAVTNIPYNAEVLKEASEPGSVTDPFDQTVMSHVPVIMEDGGLPNAGVHSDTHAEGEHATGINTEKTDGDVGCGYDKLRGPISQLIVERADEIIDLAKQKRPELFTSDEDTVHARNIIAAHGRIAEREGILPSGRDIVLKAMEAGAKGMVVRGPHVGKVGIINLRKSTKFNTTAAFAAELPAYCHDQWVALEAFDKLSHLYPYDSREVDLAETIDTIGTMLALGVEEIEVRR